MIVNAQSTLHYYSSLQPTVFLVDISESNPKTAKQLVEAASTLGFVFIDGSEFTADQVDSIFELPEEEKNNVPITADNYGYSAFKMEVLDRDNQPKGDPKEAFNFSQFLMGKPYTNCPSILKIIKPNWSSSRLNATSSA